MPNITALDVAKHLCTTHRRVSAQIEKGTLPIGYVDTTGKRRRTVIVPELWDKFLRGELQPCMNEVRK